MQWNIILKALRVLIGVILNYIKTRLWEDLKKFSKKAFEDFKVTLWENVKSEATQKAKDAINYINVFYCNPDIQNRKKAIVESVAKGIKLPLVLRPFRGVIKKMLNDKIDEMVENLISKTLNILS